jgi:hypothetical protein
MRENARKQWLKAAFSALFRTFCGLYPMGADLVPMGADFVPMGNDLVPRGGFYSPKAFCSQGSLTKNALRRLLKALIFTA